MRYIVWMLTLPFRAFEALASLLVDPPTDQGLSREEAGRLRDLELEAKADTPPYPCA